MSKDVIQLDPDKVQIHIDRKNIAIKGLVSPGMTEKTVHRMKAGKPTTRVTAGKLAAALGVAVEDLMGALEPAAMDGFLPALWLYENVDASSGITATRFQCCYPALNSSTCLIDQAPTNLVSPIDKLLKWHERRNRKIVLRREAHAFILEIHCFDYAASQMEEIVYSLATACRIFPLARSGDTLRKVNLSDWANRYVWNTLKEKLRAQAEILSFEGDEYPEDPRTYFPLVRFSKGMTNKRVKLGARAFASQYDLRESLLAFLRSVPSDRMWPMLTHSGVAITVNPVRPAMLSPTWQDDELELQIDLAWLRSDGALALAPWRQSSRESFMSGIKLREWQPMHMKHMPLRFFSQSGDGEDTEPPPFEPDDSLAAELLVGVSAN